MTEQELTTSDINDLLVFLNQSTIKGPQEAARYVQLFQKLQGLLAIDGATAVGVEKAKERQAGGE